MQIIFIGGGNIAEAIFSKLEKLNLDIIVVQKNIIKRNILAEKYPFIRFLSTLDFTPEDDDIVILALKPQDAKESCTNLPKIGGTIASVMSGITTDSLALWLNNSKIARIMPNTPAKLGLAVSGIYFSANIPSTDRQVILDIMASIGKAYIFDNEKFIDKITATAGSAPAYVFYFIEAMTNTAIEEFGFTPEDALAITLQVFKGSIALIENNPDIEVKQLRANVTSKNGTTEQAINVFDKAKLKQIITEAEIACYKRARELGNTFK
jgi:pyrroline-5-carboxylate reductase